MNEVTLTWEGERAPLAKALVAAQMATEAVKKASTNPAFKAKYADLSVVVEAVIPALNKAGVSVLQFPAFNGEMVSVATTLLHESGSAVTSTLHLRPSKLDPQGVGSAITYARRYSLLAMTGAAPEDDDGNAASGPRESQQSPNRPKPEPEVSAKATQPTTLEGWADKLEQSLLDARGDRAKVKRTFESAAKLCADLDDKLPERLSEITATYNRLMDEQTPELAIGDDEIPY